jgi:hypothetical protein
MLTIKEIKKLYSEVKNRNWLWSVLKCVKNA